MGKKDIYIILFIILKILGGQVVEENQVQDCNVLVTDKAG